MHDDWPTHREELARKTSEKLSEIIGLRKSERLTDRDALIAVNVLYDTTSGLVPNDLSALIADVHKILRKNIIKAHRDVPFEA